MASEWDRGGHPVWHSRHGRSPGYLSHGKTGSRIILTTFNISKRSAAAGMPIISASIHQRLCLTAIMLLVCLPGGVSHAASKISAVLTVKDALTVPNRPARVI